MTCAVQDLTVTKGKTFLKVLRWESSPFVYKAITAITKAAPAVITSVAHGAPDGWRVAIVSVQGMTEINALGRPPKVNEFHKATRLDANSISLNDVNSAEFSTYTSGGYVQYYTPVDLAGYTARMQVRETDVATTILLSLTTENGGITIDNAAKTITLLATAAATAAFTFSSAQYELELVSAGGVVTQLLRGLFTVEEEITK